jgi:spore maturation protein CgeB
MRTHGIKIHVYGEAEAAGSGAWCYAETLRELGAEVRIFNPFYGLGSYRKNPFKRFYRTLTKGVVPSDQRAHAAAFLHDIQAFGPEMVIVLKGLYLDGGTIGELRRRGAWVVNINHDDFFGVNRNNWSPVQRRAISAYNHIFTTREVNVAEVRPLNPDVEMFYFAYYPRIHRPVAISPNERTRWSSDVVFVGTWEKMRCRSLETLIRRVPARYAIFGTQWEKCGALSPARPAVRAGEIVLDEMAKALGGAKICLGFLRKQSRDDYTQRTFEIPGCGGMLLAERTARHQALFKEGVEAEYFDANSDDQLCQKVTELLRDEARREAIRQAGYAALLRGKHTYADRLQRLFHLYDAFKRSHPARSLSSIQ